MINRRLNWNDQTHMHDLPSALVEELILRSPQEGVYGDRALLPPAKRTRVDSDASLQQVLAQRLIQQGDYLPTLCASYTAQHLLQREHLEAKGIFATLAQRGDRFSFIDPFMFVSLFGATDSIALPQGLRTAFHQLGNAISQIHALIALLFGLESIGVEHTQKLKLAQQCWEERLTSETAIVRSCDDMYVLQPLADFVGKAGPSIATWQPWLAGHKLIRFCDDASLIPLNVEASVPAVSQMLVSLDLDDHLAPRVQLCQNGRTFPVDVKWHDLPEGELIIKIGPLPLGTLKVVTTTSHCDEADPIVSPTQPWNGDEVGPEFDQLQDAHRAGFFHAAEHLCQDELSRRSGKVLLLYQDGLFDWISSANLDRLGSIPDFHHQGNRTHFFKVNHDACRHLLGVPAVMAIQGSYDPTGSDKWILPAGGQDLRWCKICQVPRVATPRQCDELLQQQCHVSMRNMIECRGDQPLMLVNGDVLWSDTKVQNVMSIAFGGMDRLSEQPSCNVRNDEVTARLLQFNMEPGAIGLDEMTFHFDTLKILMPTICWCPPGVWANNEAQFRLPTEPQDLQRCYQHFVVPVMVLFDWIFVEVRFFEGQWRVRYHSPEQLTIRQTNAVLELVNTMGIPVALNAYRWIRTAEDNDLASWHTLRTFYARAGPPLLPESHRSSQRLQRSQYASHVMQAIDQADLVWRDTLANDRMVQFARACRSAFLIAITESPSRARDLLIRATGRPLPVYDIREIFFIADDWLDVRLNIYRTHPGWATSDEIEFIMSFFQPDSFCPPVLHHDLSLIAAGVKIPCEEVQRFVALREGHWIGIEVVCNATEHTSRRVVFLQVPPRDQQFWHDFAVDYIIPFGFRPVIIIDTNRTRPGMCGWELLHRWIVADIRIPDSFHVPNPKRLIIDTIIDESNVAWRLAGAPPMLCTFAEHVRRLFLMVGGAHLLQPCSAVSLGGMEGQASSDATMQAVDPWQFDDPWKNKKKQVKQSKWEDLQLQSDHPFVAKDETPIPFVQKQQLSTNRGGIAFVSKGNLQQAREIAPKEPCALLLPLIGSY